jgi:hypothetical protein
LDREREVEEELGEGGRMLEVVSSTGLSSTNWVGDSWQAVSGVESDSRAVDLSVGQFDTVWTVGQCGDISPAGAQGNTGLSTTEALRH